MLRPDSQIELGSLEPFRSVIAHLPWAVVVLGGLTALWSAWALVPASRRMCIWMGDDGIRFIPFVGRSVSLSWDRLSAVEDRPGRLLRPAHLALWRLRYRKPLRLYRRWYLPLDYKALRERAEAALQHQKCAPESSPS